MAAYVQLYETGELAKRAEALTALLADCRLCPRQCRVDRTRGEVGYCHVGRHARVASFDLHFGEEAPLVGKYGSGAIFFAGCNLACAFCQNDEVSQPSTTGMLEFPEATAEQLAAVMLELQARGALNINLVTPSHVIAQVVEALPMAVERGLAVPIVYNTSGYDSLETLALLDGIVDIYMPDTKFWSSKTAARYCDAPDYPDVARAAIREMHRQVGDLHMDGIDVARRGLLVRHLIMPEGLAGTAHWMRFLVEEVSPNVYVNIMDQYRPCYHSNQFPELSRPVSPLECEQTKTEAKDLGVSRLDERDGRMAANLLEQLRGLIDE